MLLHGIPQTNSLDKHMPDRESLHTWKRFTKTSGKLLSFLYLVGVSQAGWLEVLGTCLKMRVETKKRILCFFGRKFEFFSTCILCSILEKDLRPFWKKGFDVVFLSRRIWCYPESLCTPHWLALAGHFLKKTFSQLLITLIIPTYRRRRSGAFKIALMEMEMADEQDIVNYAVSEKEDGVRGETLSKMMTGYTGMYWAVLGCTGSYWGVLGCATV